MEEKKKKKLTLGVSSKTSHNVPNYVRGIKKTSILIEKKPQEDGEERNFNPEIIKLINHNLLIALFQKNHQ